MSLENEICPICNEGHLDRRAEVTPVEYNGKTVPLNTQYSVCDSCGSEQANPHQTRNNKQASLDFRKGD